MADYQIPISYVVSATTVLPQATLEPLKLSTILILTKENPVNMTGDYGIYRTVTSAAKEWGTESKTTKMIQAIFAQSPNILNNNGYVIVAHMKNSEEQTSEQDETLSEAITRISQLIYFNGVITTEKDLEDDELKAASTLVQSMAPARMFFLHSSKSEALNSSDSLFSNVQANFNTKTLYHSIADQAPLFAAAYASKLFSVNYNASNTCLTMNLKDLSGVTVDSSISEAILQQCATVGCDVYVSVEGLPKVMSNRQGSYYADQVQNSIWFANTIQREVFNTLASTRTKVAQTEAGMQIITNSISTVCQQAVTNGYLAPGKWNSADTFGNYEDFVRNIEENGYYIYHQPVAEQSQTEREARKAPMYQIAGKEAGAVHSANILIYVEP